MPETGPTQWHLFATWWRAYPQRVNQHAAWAAWQRLRPLPDQALLDRMLQTLAWQRREASWLKDGGRWIPWPASYLKDARWQDEPFEPQSSMALRAPGAWREQCPHRPTCGTPTRCALNRMREERA